MELKFNTNSWRDKSNLIMIFGINKNNTFLKGVRYK